MKTVAWLAYDDDYFYAAFEFSDPEPEKHPRPLRDRDDVPSYTDYGGIILDTRNDGKTGFMFLVNPRSIQYDAISSDASGEDPAPDLYWDSATRIRPTTAGAGDPHPLLLACVTTRATCRTWGVLLYRNRPRDFRYQMFSSKLPRGSNCFICHQKRITGLTGLPSGNHLVLAPYGVGRRDSNPQGGVLGNRLVDESAGMWTAASTPSGRPNADNGAST